MRHGHASAIVAVYGLLFPVNALNTTVNLTYSTYVGTALSNGISQWLGMRFAAPPAGELRFAPPEDPPFNASIQQADKHGLICLSTGDSPSDPSTSEDCLFLDVYAPSNATQGSKLPVFFFIQGGGFNTDSNPNYNGSGLIAASDYSIVVVNFNYRVGPYGFLAGVEGVTPNNGLLDQRKALQWVQQYISLFGGDPDHVVLGGDSAGAGSITLQLAAYGGIDPIGTAPLFHAAAAESVTFPAVLTPAQARYQFVNFAIQAGCVGSDAEAMACLRALPAATLQAVNYNVPYPGAAEPPLYMWNPTVDGDLLTQVTYDAFATGRFRSVPMIVGDDTNGGTVFTPPNTTTLAQSDIFLLDQFSYLTLEQLSVINTMYPNPNQTACPEVGCYWRQVSNAYGELRYMCPGLYISAAVARSGAPSYAYRWNVEDPTQMTEGYGVPHTVEVNAVFGPENTNGGAPASYYPGSTNAQAVSVTQAYWTSFIRSFNPNTYKFPGSAEWATWNNAAETRMLFNTSGVTVMETLNADLQERCAYFAAIGPGLLQ